VRDLWFAWVIYRQWKVAPARFRRRLVNGMKSNKMVAHSRHHVILFRLDIPMAVPHRKVAVTLVNFGMLWGFPTGGCHSVQPRAAGLPLYFLFLNSLLWTR
jgi:hypothetical protein